MNYIDSVTLLDNLDIFTATIGVVGYGFIGNAYNSLFITRCATLVYDKYRTDSFLVSLDTVVAGSELIFVAVPTPMKQSGECHTEYVESVFADILESATRIGRDVKSFIVVLKSTVPPGFTNQQKNKTGLRLVFSPEFLTEANACQDVLNANRVIIGGDPDDTVVVANYMSKFYGHGVEIRKCTASEAEMVKLSTNAHLMARVLLSNELYLICQKLGLNYDHVKEMTQLDSRIGTSHMNVPGNSGRLACGGHCFPKDINNLRHISKVLGTNEKMFTAICERNAEIRVDKDWEEMKGRAVIDE